MKNTFSGIRWVVSYSFSDKNLFRLTRNVDKSKPLVRSSTESISEHDLHHGDCSFIQTGDPTLVQCLFSITFMPGAPRPAHCPWPASPAPPPLRKPPLAPHPPCDRRRRKYERFRLTPPSNVKRVRCLDSCMNAVGWATRRGDPDNRIPVLGVWLCMVQRTRYMVWGPMVYE